MTLHNRNNEVIDYSNSFPHALIAQGRKNNVLILETLDAPRKRFDGKIGRYRLQYLCLSTQAQHPDDQAWACVVQSDSIILNYAEIATILKKIHEESAICLFDHFNLF